LRPDLEPLYSYDPRKESRKPDQFDGEARKVAGQLHYKLHKHSERISMELLATGHTVIK